MALALCLVIVFAVYSVLLGVCLARVRGITNELRTLQTLVQTIASIQRDKDSFAAESTLSDGSASTTHVFNSDEVSALQALASSIRDGQG